MNYTNNPYINNPYMNQPMNFNNPYMQNNMQPSMQQLRQQEVYQPQMINKQGLQGKVVDNIDVVKATEIPYDFSISYFPLTDGSGIVTKQLQQDGTSKITVYKPIEEKEEVQEKTNYVTIDEFKKTTEKLDYSEEIKQLSRNVEDMQDEIKKIKKEK